MSASTLQLDNVEAIHLQESEKLVIMYMVLNILIYIGDVDERGRV